MKFYKQIPLHLDTHTSQNDRQSQLWPIDSSVIIHEVVNRPEEKQPFGGTCSCTFSLAGNSLAGNSPADSTHSTYKAAALSPLLWKVTHNGHVLELFKSSSGTAEQSSLAPGYNSLQIVFPSPIIPNVFVTERTTTGASRQHSIITIMLVTANSKLYHMQLPQLNLRRSSNTFNTNFIPEEYVKTYDLSTGSSSYLSSSTSQAKSPVVVHACSHTLVAVAFSDASVAFVDLSCFYLGDLDDGVPSELGEDAMDYEESSARDQRLRKRASQSQLSQMIVHREVQLPRRSSGVFPGFLNQLIPGISGRGKGTISPESAISMTSIIIHEDIYLVVLSRNRRVCVIHTGTEKVEYLDIDRSTAPNNATPQTILGDAGNFVKICPSFAQMHTNDIDNTSTTSFQFCSFVSGVEDTEFGSFGFFKYDMTASKIYYLGDKTLSYHDVNSDQGQAILLDYALEPLQQIDHHNDDHMVDGSNSETIEFELWAVLNCGVRWSRLSMNKENESLLPSPPHQDHSWQSVWQMEHSPLSQSYVSEQLRLGYDVEDIYLDYILQPGKFNESILRKVVSEISGLPVDDTSSLRELLVHAIRISYPPFEPTYNSTQEQTKDARNRYYLGYFCDLMNRIVDESKRRDVVIGYAHVRESGLQVVIKRNGVDVVGLVDDIEVLDTIGVELEGVDIARHYSSLADPTVRNDVIKLIRAGRVLELLEPLYFQQSDDDVLEGKERKTNHLRKVLKENMQKTPQEVVGAVASLFQPDVVINCQEILELVRSISEPQKSIQALLSIVASETNIPDRNSDAQKVGPGLLTTLAASSHFRSTAELRYKHSQQLLKLLSVCHVYSLIGHKGFKGWNQFISAAIDTVNANELATILIETSLENEVAANGIADGLKVDTVVEYLALRFTKLLSLDVGVSVALDGIRSITSQLIKLFGVRGSSVSDDKQNHENSSRQRLYLAHFLEKDGLAQLMLRWMRWLVMSGRVDRDTWYLAARACLLRYRSLLAKHYSKSSVIGQQSDEVNEYRRLVDIADGWFEAAAPVSEDTQTMEMDTEEVEEKGDSWKCTTMRTRKYLDTVMRLFLDAQCHQMVTKWGEKLLQCLNAENATVDAVTNVLNVVFRSHLTLKQFDEAYKDAMRMPIEKEKRHCVTGLVIEMATVGAIAQLCQMRFDGVIDEVDLQLKNRALSQDVFELPDYYKVTYVFRVHKGDFKGAASIMYSKACLLARTQPDRTHSALDILRQQTSCLLVALNALSDTAPINQWVSIPAVYGVDDDVLQASSRLSMGRGIAIKETESERMLRLQRAKICVTLEDIKKQYVVCITKLKLVKAHPDSGNDFFTVKKNEELVELCLRCGEYELAFNLCLSLQLSFSVLFKFMAEELVNLAKQKTTSKSSSDLHNSLWNHVRVFLQRIEKNRDEKFTDTTDYRLLVIDTILGKDRYFYLPPWLLAPYKIKHVEDLLKVYLRHGLVIPAAQTAAKYLRQESNRGIIQHIGKAGMRCMPYTVLYQLQNLLQEALRFTDTRLQNYDKENRELQQPQQQLFGNTPSTQTTKERTQRLKQIEVSMSKISEYREQTTQVMEEFLDALEEYKRTVARESEDLMSMRGHTQIAGR